MGVGVGTAAHPPTPVRPTLDLGALSRAGDPADLLAELAQAVCHVDGIDACAVSEIDADRGVVRDTAGSFSASTRLGLVVAEYRLADFPVTAEVVRSGITAQVGVGDVDGDPAEREILRELRLGRVLLARSSVPDAGTVLVEAYSTPDVPFPARAVAQVELVCSFGAEALARLQLAARLESHFTATVEALVSALEARDPYTERHATRMRDLAAALALGLGLGPEGTTAIRLGALLHDVGKIGIADAILRKPDPLSAEEWAQMREHPLIGERLLAGVPALASALPVVRHHHEHWDGTGYPDGLAGEDIPLGARVVAVCDAWDAMTTDRPYRPALARPDAEAELRRGAGHQWDPACVALLLELVDYAGAPVAGERLVRYAR